MLAAVWRRLAAGVGAALLASCASACSDAGPDLAADEPERLSTPCDDDSLWECLTWAASESLRVELVNGCEQPVTVQITRGEMFGDATVLGPGGIETLLLPRGHDPNPQAEPEVATEYRLRSDGPISVPNLGAE